MISNDFNSVEQKVTFLFAVFVMPVAYGGAAVLLVRWLGPEGLICMGMPLVFMPIIMCISKANGKSLEKTNKHKDIRVRVINDMVELLKQVKMYAWEHVFKKTVE